MAVRLFNIETEDRALVVLDRQLGRFILELNDDHARGLCIALTLPELKALHEKLGEVLWDVSAGRIKMREGLEDGGETD